MPRIFCSGSHDANLRSLRRFNVITSEIQDHGFMILRLCEGEAGTSARLRKVQDRKILQKINKI